MVFFQKNTINHWHIPNPPANYLNKWVSDMMATHTFFFSAPLRNPHSTLTDLKCLIWLCTKPNKHLSPSLLNICGMRIKVFASRSLSKTESESLALPPPRFSARRPPARSNTVNLILTNNPQRLGSPSWPGFVGNTFWQRCILKSAAVSDEVSVRWGLVWYSPTRLFNRPLIGGGRGADGRYAKLCEGPGGRLLNE